MSIRITKHVLRSTTFNMILVIHSLPYIAELIDQANGDKSGSL